MGPPVAIHSDAAGYAAGYGLGVVVLDESGPVAVAGQRLAVGGNPRVDLAEAAALTFARWIGSHWPDALFYVDFDQLARARDDVIWVPREMNSLADRVARFASAMGGAPWVVQRSVPEYLAWMQKNIPRDRRWTIYDRESWESLRGWPVDGAD